MLRQHGGIQVWDAAVKTAQESQFIRHRTGAVIYDTKYGWFVKGCSHKHDGGMKINSLHAEQHALRKWPHEGGTCYIVTLTRSNNFATCSRPCISCANRLQRKMIGVCYAERANDGSWAIREVAFDALTDGYLKPTRYA